MRLSEAILAAGPLVIVEERAWPEGRDPEWFDAGRDGAYVVIEFYDRILALWWRRSPSAILECGDCGEIRFVGARKTVQCTRRVRIKKIVSPCDGTMRPINLDAAFTRRRPRRKTVRVLIDA